jgi:acyl-CoA thioester hydrolase
LSSANLAGLPVYRTKIEAGWIDYNGHLRDAYYGLILSYATDDMMDHLGLDAEYRRRTHCTLYTLEVHIHYLHEVKGSDELEVRTSILESDRKRIHVRCVFTCARLDEPVAAAEAMLLHVRQGEKPASEPFPADIAERLKLLKSAAAEPPADVPRSRPIAIKRS